MHFRTHIKELGKCLNERMPRLQGYLHSCQIPYVGYPYVCFHNMDSSDWDVEIGVPVAHPLPAHEDMVPGFVDAYLMATTIHRGPLGSAEEAYLRLQKWMHDHGHLAIGPVFEVYMNDPRGLPPDQVYVGVMIPIRRISP